MDNIQAATARLSQITCQKCGGDGPVLQYHCIDVSAHPELRGLLEEDFYQWYCPHCGAYAAIAYPCRYFDARERLSVALRTSVDARAVATMNAVSDGLRQEGYLHRVVKHFPAMAEIVRIREAELDDRAVQLLKPFIVGPIQSAGGEVWDAFFLSLEESGEDELENVVYMAADADREKAYREPVFRFAVYMTDGMMEEHGINLTAYRHCRKILRERGLEEDGLYHLYDLSWAVGFHNGQED